MNGYMLLLHSPTQSDAKPSAEEIKAVIADYIAWRNEIDEKGRLIGGDKLANEGGRHLKAVNGEIKVTDGPYAEVKEALGGFFAIKAKDYDEAVSISRSCPHLKYGGWIELREIEEH